MTDAKAAQLHPGDRPWWYFGRVDAFWKETGDAVADRAVIAAHPDAMRVVRETDAAEPGCTRPRAIDRLIVAKDPDEQTQPAPTQGPSSASQR